MTRPGAPARTTPRLLAADAGEVLHIRGNVLSIKLAADDARSRLSIVEYVAPAGFPGPAPHVHPGFDETFYVLDGTLTIHVEAERAALEPGGLGFVPGDVPHTFANDTGTPVRFLVLCSPGGFEDHFRLLAQAASTAQPPDAEKLAAVSARYGLRDAALAAPATVTS